MGMTTGWFEHYPHPSSDQQKPAKDSKSLQGSKLTSLLQQFKTSLTKLLTCSSEPQIWQKRDRQGNLVWRMYDPQTNQSAVFASEEEVRIWLEERYCR
jgi:hypothetical protein